MQSPSRHRDRFPIPPHIPGFAASAFNSKLSTVNFLLSAFFVFSTLQTPLLRKAPRSISNFFPLNSLQTPRFATPLFSHPYKTGGCGICRSSWRTAGCAVHRSVWRAPRCRSLPLQNVQRCVRDVGPASFFQRSPAYLRPFGAKPNLSLAVPKNATYNLPSTISGAHHGRRQKQQIAEISQQTQWQTE